MQNNTISNAKIHKFTENDPLSGSKSSTKQSGLSFVDTLSSYLPDIKQPNATEAISMQKTELRAIANMLLEEFRIQNETKRLELIEKLLNKSKNDNEDSYSKCLEIFKKLMRGERVSPDEMKYLMQFAPLLFLLYQMLNNDEAVVEEENAENENADEHIGTDKSSSLAEAVLSYSPDISAAAS